MAILTQPKNYKAGDSVSADVINDTIDTAIGAYQKSAGAETAANNAVNLSNSAVNTAEDAVNRSNAASDTSNNALNQAQSAHSVVNNANNFAETAKTDAASAKTDAQTALSKVTTIEQMANSGAFNGAKGADGTNAAFVETSGMYGFQIDGNGDLLLNYSVNNAPDFAINGNGELIYSY